MFLLFLRPRRIGRVGILVIFHTITIRVFPGRVIIIIIIIWNTLAIRVLGGVARLPLPPASRICWVRVLVVTSAVTVRVLVDEADLLFFAERNACGAKQAVQRTERRSVFHRDAPVQSIVGDLEKHDVLALR